MQRSWLLKAVVVVYEVAVTCLQHSMGGDQQKEPSLTCTVASSPRRDLIGLGSSFEFFLSNLVGLPGGGWIGRGYHLTLLADLAYSTRSKYLT